MTYTVRSGDTLSAIAKSFNTTVWAISEANGIRNPNVIRVGQVLTIPGMSPAGNNQFLKALVACLDAIEDLPEFKTLSGLLEED